MKPSSWFMQRLVRAAAAAVVCLLGTAAGGQEVIDASDGKPRSVVISANQFSRIAVEGGRIVSFVVSPEDLEYKEEPALGQVFVAPRRPGQKAISAFVVTDSGATHALVLEPRDVPLQTIIIREQRRVKAAETDTRPVSRQSVERASSYDAALKRLVLAMARGERPPEFTVQDGGNQLIPLWREVRFVLVSVYRGRSLTGEFYRLTNVSNAPIRLAEQELFKEGVSAVSIELHELAPGQTTDVFVIKGGGNG